MKCCTGLVTACLAKEIQARRSAPGACWQINPGLKGTECLGNDTLCGFYRLEYGFMGFGACFLIFSVRPWPRKGMCCFLLLGEALVLLEHKSKEKQLMELRLFSLKERRLGDTFSLSTWEEAVARCGSVSQVASDTRRGSGLKLCQVRFRLDIQKNFCAEIMGRHQTRLSRAVLEPWRYLEDV